MQMPEPRGPLTERLSARLAGEVDDLALDQVDVDADGVLSDDDAQLALWLLYEQHYRGLDGVDDRLEWDPGLLGLRARLEEPLEQAVRDLVAPVLDDIDLDEQSFDEAFTRIVQGDDGPSVAAYVQREATAEQVRELLMLRSVFHLKESDPQAWLLPRLHGRGKVALAELLYDEFGAGRPECLHQDLFATALRGAGLDDTYGAHFDLVPASTLAVNNVMSMFGLHRRLRAAGVGHLAAFEATSSLPCRKIVQGIARLGLGEDVAQYFDEHVEADAVHEHVARRDIAGALVAADDSCAREVLMGAAACVRLDQVVGAELVGAWEGGRSALRGAREVAA